MKKCIQKKKNYWRLKCRTRSCIKFKRFQFRRNALQTGLRSTRSSAHNDRCWALYCLSIVYNLRLWNLIPNSRILIISTLLPFWLGIVRGNRRECKNRCQRVPSTLYQTWGFGPFVSSLLAHGYHHTYLIKHLVIKEMHNFYTLTHVFPKNQEKTIWLSALFSFYYYSVN